MTFEDWLSAGFTEAPTMRAAWEAATAAERERCARLAEDRHKVWNAGDGYHDGEGFPAVNCDATACANIAAAIRARPAEGG